MCYNTFSAEDYYSSLTRVGHVTKYWCIGQVISAKEDWRSLRVTPLKPILVEII